ncbi:hypothetical protein [Arcticibacterium luteifluviistationis]|uniref:Uncharacterized protein n=1 Tax=Arcticibacterium luteifluviistationis TaxID=1784714 RepID=A0A2Z4GD45_9BACT|nr:hypothetical protein [Arcticibacterium luteifluviistationis]AWV98945.1 hypothetical protein DJ013_12500 [Arcticibacterium luteifluviistationis]
MKILKYIVLVLAAFLWLEGCSTGLSTWLFERGLVKDDYRYGDLYRMSNLSKFRELKETCSTRNLKKESGTHLVLAGDSFTEFGRMDSSNFVASKYSYIRVDGNADVQLDTSAFNVLVIETVERHFRERFVDVWDGVNVVSNQIVHSVVEKPSFLNRLINLEMPYSTELHEGVLFGYDCMMTIRDWKAALNYKLFDRVDDNVRLNKTGEHLLYYLPSEPGISSAFDEITKSEIDSLVNYVNATALKYKEQGFDKVILSVIPNKTSILGRDLGNYNQLISRIQNHPNLKTQVLDAYGILNKLGAEGYAKGDTHWNCQGKLAWETELNKEFKPI